MAMTSNWFTLMNAGTAGLPSANLRLTFAISELQDLLTGIASFKQTVNSMPYLHSRSGVVLPIECDHLMNIIRQTRAILEKGILLLRPPESTPETLGSYNYSLLLKLHSSMDKMSSLLDMTEKLRSSCAGDGIEAAQILAKLQKELSSLLHEQAKIESEIGSELDALLLTVS